MCFSWLSSVRNYTYNIGFCLLLRELVLRFLLVLIALNVSKTANYSLFVFLINSRKCIKISRNDINIKRKFENARCNINEKKFKIKILIGSGKILH